MVDITSNPRRHWRLVLSGLALAVVAGPALATDPLLERMAGEWVGRGFVRATSDGSREPAYCRTTNVLAGDGESLTQSGRCAFGPDSGTFSSRLTALDGGRYQGVSESPLVDGEATVTGSAQADRLNLVSRGRARGGEAMEAEITIEIGGDNSYTMRTSSADPETGEPLSVELVFTPAE